jgi:phosphatidylinositol kinase/protein kinase (PI-3  family)
VSRAWQGTTFPLLLRSQSILLVSVEMCEWLGLVCVQALRFKEMEFRRAYPPSSAVIEELISINNQLQQKEAAIGVLRYAQTHKVCACTENLKSEGRSVFG